MSNIEDRPAILGGEPVRPMPKWPRFSERAEQLVADALASGKLCGYWGNDAPYRTQLETEVAAHAGWRYGIAVTNGTDAIRLAIHALLVQRGRRWSKGRDTILAPDFTWVPGTLAGARIGVLEYGLPAPRFLAFDSRAEDWTIDEQALIAWLGDLADRALAVLVPSLLDTTPQLEAIVAAAARHGVPVVHDGAQAGGAVRSGLKPACETRSFQLGKSEGGAAGEGGIVLTDDDQLATIMRRLTDCWGVPGGPLDPGGSLDGIEVPFASNVRMSALPAAGALGGHYDLVDELPTIRSVRRAIGTEIKDPDGLVVFRTPPIQPDWEDAGPTYGFGAVLTREGRDAYALDADQWREILAADGFANDAEQYKFGVRRPYGAAHVLEPWNRAIVPAYPDRGFPRVDRIARNGLMFHVLHLLDERTPEYLTRSVARVARDGLAMQQHFGIG